MTLYTSKAVADYLGLTDRRVRQLRDEGVLPEERPGLWELRGTVRRYTAYLRKGSDGLTDRRVRQLRDEGVLPEERPGLWELRGTVRRYTAYLRKGSDDLNAERTRLTAEKRKAAERENRIRDGEVHRTEDIERAMRTLLLNTRGNLLSLPAKLAPELATLGGNEPEIFDRLRTAIREALEDLSDYRTALAAPEEEEADEEGAKDH